MRILMLTQGYPPLIGGEERHVRNLSAELAERGHEVSVATIWHKGMLRFELDRSARLYRIPSAVQRAMETLIANPDRRIRMGAAARRKVVAFKAASVVPRIEQLYVDLLSRRS